MSAICPPWLAAGGDASPRRTGPHVVGRILRSVLAGIDRPQRASQSFRQRLELAVRKTSHRHVPHSVTGDKACRRPLGTAENRRHLDPALAQEGGVPDSFEEQIRELSAAGRQRSCDPTKVGMIEWGNGPHVRFAPRGIDSSGTLGERRLACQGAVDVGYHAPRSNAAREIAMPRAALLPLILLVSSLSSVCADDPATAAAPLPSTQGMRPADRWATMIHGYAFLVSNRQGGRLGERRFESVNHL